MKHRFFALLLAFCASLFVNGEPMAWRGVMLDVSRHFMPMEFLYRQVDAMQHFGLNRLHLHLTDAAGWRMEIRKYPHLTQVGAWRPEASWETWWNGDRSYGGSYGGYYTQQELRQLVAYAAERGVMIVPEIEFPAHSEEVVAAYPQLGFNHAELDMQNEEVYRFMADVLSEVADVFPSPYLHVGGDEAATQHDLQPMGMRRLQHICDSLGRRMIVWDEALTDEPADSASVIMVWRDAATAERALRLGHQVIMCPGRWCYLDKCQDAPATQPKSMGGYLPLRQVYDFEPTPGILGIQCNVWCEYIPTPQHAEYMLWPRAIAIAEIASGQKRDWKRFHRSALQGVRWLRDSLGVNAFDLANEVGERPERSRRARSLAVGCPITYVHAYHNYYPASGEGALTDGLCGGWSNTDGRWQGFIGRQGMDVVVDLGRKRRIHSVGSTFLQSTGPEIFLPNRLVVSVSLDGEHYETVLDRSYPDDVRPERYEFLSWQGKTHARYVRLQALPGQRQGWIFADEIIVR